MSTVATSALDLIGNTPLIEIGRAYRGPGRILAKVEFLQPGGSMKDRNGLWAIRAARASGTLAPGQPVVETTSGNMGAGLAVACGQMGHPFIATMSEGNSPRRALMMRALGAEVILVPQVDGTPGKVTRADIVAATGVAEKIVRDRGAFHVDQWRNPACIAAHYDGTGAEIWSQTDGNMDAFVMIVGSAATFVGVSRFLKEKNPAIICAAVEPDGAAILAGHPVSRAQHILQGTGYALVPPHWEPALADEMLTVSDAEAEHWRQRLGVRESLYVGYSAAANVAAAATLLASGKLNDEATVVTILCDSGLKY